MTTSAIVEKEAAQEACAHVLPVSIGEMLCVAKAMITVNPGPVLPVAHLGESLWSPQGTGKTSLDPSIAAIITSEPRYTARWDTGFLPRNRPVRPFEHLALWFWKCASKPFAIVYLQSGCVDMCKQTYEA